MNMLHIERKVVEFFAAIDLTATGVPKGFASMVLEARLALAAQQEPPATGETKTYSDGTLVTGTQPLPRYSPREMDILYLALEVAQKAWEGNCEYAEIEGLAWNLRSGLRDLFKDAGIPLDKEPPTAVPDALAQFAASQKPLPADIAAVLHDNLWDLYATGDEPAVPDAAKPEPQGEISGCACRWDKDDNRVQTCERHQGWLDVVHEWAERAKAAEAALLSTAPTQAQPLTDAQITVLLDSYYDSDASPVDLIKKVETLHGITKAQP